MNEIPPRRRVAAVVVGLTLTMLCGCEHPRLSLHEFLQMEPTAMPADAAVATQPPDFVMQAREIGLGPARIGPDDVLSVTITPGHEQATAAPVRQRVGDQGEIDLPLVGATSVAGLTLSQAERRIKAAYVPSHYRDAMVHVELAEPEVVRVMVIGQVAAPGLVPLRRHERNILLAVDRAGGSTLDASGAVTLRRLNQPDVCQTVNLRCPDELRQSLTLAPLADGDIIYVHPAQPNTVFVGGLVTAGGPQIYPQGTSVTVLQALAAAGGPRPDLFASQATLIRRCNGKDVHVKLNLDRMARGLDPNFELAAGDILWMPHTAGTRVMEFVNNNLYFRAGMSASYNATWHEQGARFHGDLRNQRVQTTVPLLPGEFAGD